MLVILDAARNLIYLLIMARMVVSFLPPMHHGHPLVRMIESATEPLLAPFRSILPSNRIGIDFSPLLLMLVVDLLFRIAIQLF
jgi:uncharacterized protein YggT (Ycf19 family)